MDRNARKAHKIRGFRAISAPYLWLRDCGCLAEDRTPTFPFEYRPLKSQRNSASFAPIPGLETFAVDRTFRDHRHTSGWTYVPSKEQKLPRRWRRQLWAMCGRLRVGKKNLHVAGLVGAAMCSACLRGTHDRWP